MTTIIETIVAIAVLFGGDITITMRELPSGQPPQAGVPFQQVWMVWPNDESVDGVFYFVVDYPDHVNARYVSASGEMICLFRDKTNVLYCTTDEVTQDSRIMIEIVANGSFDSSLLWGNRIADGSTTFPTQVQGGTALVPPRGAATTKMYLPLVMAQ